MKKIVSMFLCISMAIAIGCMVTGCGNDEVLKRIDALQTQNTQLAEKLDEMQNIIDGQTDKIDELEIKATRGMLYTLKEAYEFGYLTMEELKSIAYYNNGGRWHNEEIMSESYTPLPKTPEVLSAETELKIKMTAAKGYREDGVKQAEAKGFRIVKYCGIYSGCISVLIFDDYSGSCDAEWVESVSEVNFCFNQRGIQIWREL